MKFRDGVGVQAYGTSHADTRGSQKRHGRRGGWIAIICLGMIFGSLTLRAGADTTIYLYSNGTPVDVTASYSLQQHLLYDEFDTLVATLDDSGFLYNLSGQQIGYVVSTPDGTDP